MMAVFGGIKWIGLAVATLLLAALLGGCVSVTDGGVTFMIRPIVDTRIPSPAAVEALAELDAECIDLQTADVELLQAIRHIGPYRAEYIADIRELLTFEGVEDLRVVPGIGDGLRLAQIREQNLVCGTE